METSVVFCTPQNWRIMSLHMGLRPDSIGVLSRQHRV